MGGCVQGSIGYWKKIRDLYPKKFNRMAENEHKISHNKGKPVTICKDQRKTKKGNRIFLKHNPEFPLIENIDDMKGRYPVGLMECDGFCGVEMEFQ